MRLRTSYNTLRRTHTLSPLLILYLLSYINLSLLLRLHGTKRRKEVTSKEGSKEEGRIQKRGIYFLDWFFGFLGIFIYLCYTLLSKWLTKQGKPG